MRAEALSQVLPFVSCSRPRVQNAALWSLERMAEDHSSGGVGGGKTSRLHVFCVCCCWFAEAGSLYAVPVSSFVIRPLFEYIY